MKSRNNIAIVLLLTMAIILAFTSPVSANGFISGTVLDNQAKPISGANVTATNGTNSPFYFITNDIGVYVITIPTASTNRIYTVRATKTGYFGSAVQNLLVTDLDTTVAQNIVLTKATYPTTKVDTASPSRIPADRGTSSTVITATIRDQDGNLLIGGSVNSTTTALVHFQLRNGSLDVTTGNNGSLSNTGGGIQIGGFVVVNVPINARGNATVTLNSGSLAGTVEIFNLVSVSDINGKEVNATITVTFTPLQGQVTGTVRSSESARLENATVSAYRLVWTFNFSDARRGLDPWDKVWEPIKSTVTDSIGDYVLPFIDLKYDVIGNTDLIWSFYEYNEETLSFTAPDDMPPPLVSPPITNNTQLLTNYIMVKAVKSPYNDGLAYKFLSVDETETADVVLTSGQADQLLVQIDGTEHQLTSDAAQNTRHTVTGKLLKANVPFAVANEEVNLTISDLNLSKFVVNGAVVDSRSIIVKTDASGVATATIQTSVANVGTVRITGTHTTRDNVFLSDWDFLNVASVGEVSGTVSNEANVNIAGATVKLYEFNATSREFDIYPVSDIYNITLGDKTSNTIGFYTFTNVPSGRYMVRADTADGKVGYHYNVFVTTGTVDANVVVLGAIATGSINGTVTSNGTALAGVDIFLGSNTVKSATTDSNGKYTISDVSPGTYTVKAVKSGYNDASVSGVIVLSASTATANIALTPVPPGTLASITVSPTSATLNVSQTQAFTATGKDAANNPVTITPTWTSSNISVGTITSGGVFTAVANGTTTVTATSGAITSAGVTVKVGSASSLVDSYLPPGGTAAEWKAGVIRAMDDYFAEPPLLTKTELMSIMDAYFS
jgi:hypothetical protein